MGALLFLSIFLASFLVGSGASTVYQNTSVPTNSNATPTSTPINPSQQACLPEAEMIQNNYRLAVGGDGVNPIVIDADEDHYNAGLPGGIGIEPRAAWTKVLLYLFGGVPKPGEHDAGNIAKQRLLDRRTKEWVLIKRDAPIPAWKMSYINGGFKWNLSRCIWQATDPDVCAGGSTETQMYEATRIGHLDLATTDLAKMPAFLKERYKNLQNSESDPEAKLAIGDVWIPTGWCNMDGWSDQACEDPVVVRMLYVVTKKGAGRRIGRVQQESGPTDPKWKVDIYWNYNGETVLPCWMGSCNRNPDTAIERKSSAIWDPNFRISDPACTNHPITYNSSQRLSEKLSMDWYRKLQETVSWYQLFIAARFDNFKASFEHLAATFFNSRVLAESGYPQFISGYAIQYSDATIKDKIQGNTYMFAASGGLPSSNKVIGTLTNSGVDFQVVINADSSAMPLVPTGVPAGEITEVFLQNSSAVYQYYIVHSNKGQGYTLKLETFHPPVVVPTVIPINTTYDWWWPACKPAIYLYPQTEEKLSVFVEPQGYITESIPTYGDGWRDIVARPDGTIVAHNTIYPYLYYEANLTSITAPTTGWMVHRDNLASFFESTLPKLGLNGQEARDFSDYWLHKLTDKPYYFVGLVERNELDSVEKISFSHNPDTFIRVRMFFEGLHAYQSVLPYSLSPTPRRIGFTAVDWGGIIKNGSCNSGVLLEQKAE